jgi:Arc/MetJ-type ribon-helix-helix transcriptional regulator
VINYNISINEELAEIVEQMMKAGRYTNRSEFFRDLIRKYYINEMDMVIEELDENDPDYKYIQERKKDAEFITLEELEHDLQNSRRKKSCERT